MVALALQSAFEEITLVLFTTLAPSGVLAFVILAIALIADNKEFDTKKLHRALCFPLIVTTVGLIASATHLGNPANALYVFTRVGHSPLATEVFFAVVFLLFAGGYWLYSFAQKPHKMVQKAWLVLIVIAGLVFIHSIAFAYAVPTIISWSTVFVPVNLWLNAFVGGPIVTLFTMQLAKFTKKPSRFGKTLLAVSALALVANLVCLVMQHLGLANIENSLTTAQDLVPFNGVLIVLFGVGALAAILLYAIPFRQMRVPTIQTGVLACFLVYLGIFAVRFSFYTMHMTTGMSL